jgi:ParB-like chromosome segregation protein Spo0J
MKLSEIRENPKNPRLIKDENFQKLVRSIQEFPEMLEARPIVVNPEGIIIGGNMRYKACKAAGLIEAPVYIASWGETKDREFIIKDNVSAGENDMDILANEWDATELNDWGLNVWDPQEEEEQEKEEKPKCELCGK